MATETKQLTDRELDAVVAHDIFGWTDVGREGGTGSRMMGIPPFGSYSEVPRFSNDISSVWQIVEKAKDFLLEKGSDHWFCGITFNNPKFGLTMMTASTVPKAICLAAVRAIRVEKDDV